MDEVRALAREHRPKMIVTGATAYPRLWDFAAFREIADEVGALLFDRHGPLRGPRGGRRPPVAGAALRRRDDDHPQDPARSARRHDPVPRGARQGDRQVRLPRHPGRAAHARHRRQGGRLPRGDDREFRADQQATVDNARVLASSLADAGASIISGGTDNHLMLVDVRPLGVNGKEADAALGEVRITVNKNTIPYDPEKPMIGSGIRVGTPAVTSRGMREAEMREIASLIVDGIAARGDARPGRDPPRVAAITDRFPVPGCPGRAPSRTFPPSRLRRIQLVAALRGQVGCVEAACGLRAAPGPEPHRLRGGVRRSSESGHDPRKTARAAR